MNICAFVSVLIKYPGVLLNR